MNAATNKLINALHRLSAQYPNKNITAIQSEDGSGSKFNIQIDAGVWQFIYLPVEAEISPLDKAKEKILLEAGRAISTRGYYKKSTVDGWFSGWNADEHHALLALHRNPPADMIIQYCIQHSVYDWTIKTT
jgi:hypothetical protein